MRNDGLIAAGFAAACIACAVCAWLLRGLEYVPWIAAAAAVLLGLNAGVSALRCRYTARDRTKISAVTVSKAAFEHEPRIRGKSPPPGQ